MKEINEKRQKNDQKMTKFHEPEKKWKLFKKKPWVFIIFLSFFCHFSIIFLSFSTIFDVIL